MSLCWRLRLGAGRRLRQAIRRNDRIAAELARLLREARVCAQAARPAIRRLPY